MNGYKIIDFKGESVMEGHVDGIFARIHNTTKPLIFCNYVYSENGDKGIPYNAGFGLYRSVDAETYGYDFVLTTTSDGAVIFTITDKDDIVIGA